ncbi:hypothetical protein HGRIS_004897 [Hohenbuehelia grisea]|uniref:Dystroglycan-type cadherin-like domain-containing protein n=1 Tax=Hohenbuehelia grisea TaxID=104357 RepID=A0ABR3JDB8_9AGAR
MFLSLLSLLAIALPAYSSIVISNPLDSQLPFIARIGQPYSWAFSPDTFSSSTANKLQYSVASNPDWLSFDSASRTFSGTPSAKDEGNPEVSVIAKDGSSSALSRVTLCVTPYPPPTLNLAIADQFHAANPSLSSVFLLSANSAIKSSNPALRIPPKWSFSIGFEGKTFTAPNSLFYEVLQANGSELPSWIDYNHKTLTLNGVTPNADSLASPQILSLALHASDQEGYTAAIEPFDVVLASHELWSVTDSLPTINVTASTPFSVSLTSPADFTGVFIDKEPLHPTNISTFVIDTSQYSSWLTFEGATRVLSGNPPADLQSQGGPTLPVLIQTTFNQSIRTNVSLAVVPSYFSTESLPGIQAADDGALEFNLVPFFANSTSGEVDLSASFEPAGASSFLSFDSEKGLLKGNLPADFMETRNQTEVTFTAYSRVTHSTSHASLAVTIPPSMYQGSGSRKNSGHRSQLSLDARKRLTLGLGIAFGLIGGIGLVGATLALVRHCARVDDTAVGGEAGRNVWSEKDRKWYGIDVENQRGNQDEQRQGSAGSPQDGPVSGLEAFFGLPAGGHGGPNYGDLGTRRPPPPLRSPSVTGSNVMSKREFMTKIKDTVRQVSDQYRRIKLGPQNNRIVIGRPVPIPSVHQTQSVSSNPFNASVAGAYQASSIGGASLESGDPDRSIPHRRADFEPRRSPASVHFADDRQGASPSDSTGSLGSDADAAEAVVQTASRATSIKSGRSGHAETRPRLVPFTSSSRVPVPQYPPAVLQPGNEEGRRSARSSKRISSHSALVVDGVDTTPSSDDLDVSIQYVRTLGEAVDADPSTPTMSTNVRSSFSSLESSHHGHGSRPPSGSMQRMLVRTGQKFHFRVPVLMEASPSAYTRPRALKARLLSGGPLPKFIRAELNGKQQGSVEFYGTPKAADIGDLQIGVFKDEECVARVLLEVVAHQRG